MKPITIIVAIAQNNAIGCENKLLWHIPADLKRFKSITIGHIIVMGMSTYESLPRKPLIGRTNIVMTRKNIELEGCKVANSVEQAITMFSSDKENFIIGGAQIYEAFLPYANKLLLTIVHRDFAADTFFPKIDFTEWKEVEREDFFDTGDLGFDYSYITYIRKI
jgi:dihydrofolate reductase